MVDLKNKKNSSLQTAIHLTAIGLNRGKEYIYQNYLVSRLAYNLYTVIASGKITKYNSPQAAAKAFAFMIWKISE